MTLDILEMPLLTDKYTQVLVDRESVTFGAPHHFVVVDKKKDEEGQQRVVEEVNFQMGPIKENGVNGCCNEDLINMVICRLEGFQNGNYSCDENKMAIQKLEEALMWLRKRTIKREKRNVEGTSEI